VRRLLGLLLLALPAGMPQAQSVHAYRDASGQWVFTDRGAGAADAHGNAFTRPPHSPEALHVAVERSDSGTATRLTAVNDCLCVVTLRVEITQSDLAAIPSGATYPATLEPGGRALLIDRARITAGGAQPAAAVSGALRRRDDLPGITGVSRPLHTCDPGQRPGGRHRAA